MKLEEAKKLYPNEWIAFRIDEDGDNPEGEVLLHDKDRREFGKRLAESHIVDVYVFYSGSIPEGYAIMF
ncbi:MAG: hypothetical protein B1H03_06200 [Planctomycetales bacterium 4484_113]|nr:MAG: hypothetical protein B1H03_06200 [Planctomycetales bacterium 4484_113]